MYAKSINRNFMRIRYSDRYSDNGNAERKQPTGRDTEILWRHIVMAILIGILLAISGCDKYAQDGTTVGQAMGQKVDKAIDKTNATVEKAQAKIADAGQVAGHAVKAAGDSVHEKAGQVATIVEDSAITASIKADLLKDPGLSALAVEVNTVKGEVTLRGEVQSEALRDRAARIALAVAGVTKVNNSITIKG